MPEGLGEPTGCQLILLQNQWVSYLPTFDSAAAMFPNNLRVLWDQINEVTSIHKSELCNRIMGLALDGGRNAMILKLDH